MIVLLSPADRIELVPEVSLESWVIQEVQSSVGVTYHFIGFIDGRGRISTPITVLDIKLREGHTVSGRLYKLVGPPGDVARGELNAIYKASSLKYKAISVRDVTLAFLDKRH